MIRHRIFINLRVIFVNFILAKDLGSVVSWSQVLDLGKGKSDNELDVREKNAAVNKACMYMYTSGTTGSPKGKMHIKFHNLWP